MGRDLLYKPQVPVMQPEESGVDKKADKAGAKARSGRDLGGVGQTPAQQITKSQTQAPKADKPKAFQAAYFNNDSSGVREVNLRQSNVAALRGAEGATDLRKVVLPPSAMGIESPDPGQLRGATDLMGLDGSFELNLEGLLGRQGAWAHSQGVTAEMIMQRLKQLEQMVADRKRALLRMAKNRGKKAASSVTVEQAVQSGGKALEQADDVVAAGGELVGRTAAQAEGMHRRIRKMLGIKTGQ